MLVMVIMLAMFDRGLGQILHNNFTGSTYPTVFKLAMTVHWCMNGYTPPYLSQDYRVRLLVLTVGGICIN